MLATGGCAVCKNSPVFDKAVLYPVLFSMSRDIKKFPREVCALKSATESIDKKDSDGVTTSKADDKRQDVKASEGVEATVAGCGHADADADADEPVHHASEVNDASKGSSVDCDAVADVDVDAMVENAATGNVVSYDQKSKCVLTVCSMNCVLEVERKKFPGDCLSIKA